ncbi:MAG: hypothetical protein MR384_13395 [Lachnospiraceae bacterium]|nr:hypothetical protein [Lachnospiraceae bacterium]
MLSDEEKKKREEEAKNIISSMSGFTDSINTINYNNYNIKTNNDYDKEYVNRVKEANDIINSINPREDVSTPDLTDEEKRQSKENTQSILNLMDNNDTSNSSINNSDTSKYGLGNIDLTNRPIVHNDDGSISTVRSMSFEDEDGKEVLVPTVSDDGRIMSNDEAIQQYYKTRRYLGKFDSIDEANAYAEQLHNQQEQIYSKYENNNQKDNVQQENNQLDNIDNVKKTDNTPTFTRNIQSSDNTAQFALANSKDTQNVVSDIDYKLQNQKQEKDNKNIFERVGTWVKDLIGSIGVDVKNTATGLYKTVKEGIDERKEAVNNMTNEELQNASNKSKTILNQIAPGTLVNSINNNNSNQKTKLIINDTLQDITRSSVNGLIDIANNVLNFLSYGNLSKNTLNKVTDNSVLQNSEQYGKYSSQEELTKSIQNDKKEDLQRLGLYNPSANTVADITTDIATFLLLKKAGLGSTSAMVASGTTSTLGQTGNVEEATKTAVSDYVFSKVLDSKLINEKLGDKVYNGTKNKIFEQFKNHEELLNPNTQAKIMNAVGAAVKTGVTTGVSRFTANELQAIGNYGIDANNKDVQKNILFDTITWSAIYAGISGFTGMYAQFGIDEAEVKKDVDAKKQLDNYYSLMELDSSKEYTLQDLDKQHKALVKKYHPDLSGNNTEQMALINNAYDEISKYIKTGKIDKVIVKTENTNTAPKESNIKQNQDGIIVTNDGKVYVDTDSILKDTASNIAKTQVKPAITIMVDNNNNVTGLEKVQAVPFDVEGSKLPDITPAVYVSEDGSINVIDTNSGTKLLTNAISADTAINTVTKALQIGDDNTINKIKNEVLKNNISVENSVGQVIDSINAKVQENNSIDSSENSLRNNLNNEPTNYTSENKNTNISQKNNLEEISSMIKQISNNGKYNKDEARNIINYVSDSLDNVKVEMTPSGKAIAYSIDDDGNIAYSTGVDKIRYTGSDIKEMVNNLVNNANIPTTAKEGLSTIEETNIPKVKQTRTSTSMENRTYENVGNKNILPYAEEHPEVAQDIKDMAANFMEDLANSIPGERYKAGDTWTGQKRSTTKELANFKDTTGASWNKIGEILNDIYEGKGNYALAKKMELELDKALTEGYKNAYGKNIMPNEEYLKKKGSIEGKDYLSIYENNDYIPDDNDARIFGMKKKVSSENYDNYKNLISKEEQKALNNFNPSVDIKIPNEIKNINIKDIKQTEAIKLAKTVFRDNNKTRTFKNDETNNKIKVIADDIKESIHKTFSNKSQKKYLRENIASFAQINSIIKNGKKVSESNELKNRSKYKEWNYYIVQANINDNPFLIEYDVSKQEDGWHLRVERLKKINIKKVDTPLAATKKSMLIQGKSTFINNSITPTYKIVNSEKSVTNNKSMQKEKNNTSNDIRLMKKNTNSRQNGGLTKTEYDNQGNPIAFKTAQFFKDSKVRDDNGNLIVMYHGSQNEFSVFDKSKIKTGISMYSNNGDGFYFTDSKELVKKYSKGKIYKTYLNITNPLVVENPISKETSKILTEFSTEIYNRYKTDIEKERFSQYKIFNASNDIAKQSGSAILSRVVDKYGNEFTQFLKSRGYDGIKTSVTDYFGTGAKFDYIAFESNQIKNITNTAPTSNEDIRYMKKPNTIRQIAKDNQGRTLTRQQQEYFKNSKVRDDKGNLKTVYHGTDKKFTVFNYDYLGKNGTANGKGFYLADDINVAKSYSDGKNLIEAYVDIEKPLSIGNTTMSENDYIKFLKAVNDKTNGVLFADYGNGEKIPKGSKQYNEIVNQFRDEYSYGGDDVDLVLSILNSANISLEDGYRLLRQTTGYDGIIVESDYRDNGKTIPYTQYIPLTPEQIKNVDNTNPTNSTDIRYMKRQKGSSENIEISKELHNRIQNALLSKNSRGRTYLGNVSSKIANKIEQLFGYDVTDRRHVLADNDIRHMIKEHGNPEIEKMKGQIAITTKDIEKIPDIINNYDKIVQGTDNKQGKTIRYIKKYSDNISYVVEVVPEKGSALKIKTMWKKSAGVTNSQTTPSSTSMTKSNLDSSTSNTSIAPIRKNVKGNIISHQNIRREKKNPESDDIISETERQNLIKKSKHNGERDDAYIEQAIKEIQLRGKWDENIKPIGTSEIIKFIEDSFDNKIEKGNFRQHAYAIYKENRDIIRTKSMKDIDSIVHEVFHRLYQNYNVKQHLEEIYQEVVTPEVLELYSNLNEEDITNEGFAEMGRRCIVQKDYIEHTMPKTIAILEDLKNNDPELKKFLEGLTDKVHDYIFEAPWNRTEGSLSFAPKKEQFNFKESYKNAKNQFITNVLNKDYALEMATDFMGKGMGYINSYELDPKDNPVIQNALKQGIGDKIDSILKDGIYDLETGEKLCDGIEKVGKILPNTQDQKNLSTYLTALRAKEAAEKGKKTGIRYDDAKLTIEKFSKDKRLEEARIIYQTFQNTLLEQAKKAGLYSQKDIDLMKENWLNYATFYRVMDDNNKGSSLMKNPIKKFVGSERDIINPLESTVIMLGRIYPAMQRNITMKSFVELGELSYLGGTFYDIIPTPMKKAGTEHLEDFKKALENQGIDTEGMDLSKTYDLYYPDRRDNRKERITSYKVNGKEVTLQFRDDKMSKELYDVFTGGYDKDVPNLAKKILAKTAKIFRYGTTILNPKFVVNNISSDTQQAATNAKGNFIPYVDSVKGLADVIIAKGINMPTSLYNKLPKETIERINNINPEQKERIQKMYALFKQSGASGGTRTSLYSNRNETSRKMADLLNSDYKELGLKKNKIKSVVDILSIPSELSEEATRFGVFMKNMDYLQNKGSGDFLNSLIDSAYNTRNATQDFSTGGNTIKRYSAYIPYLSAKVGSIENSRIIYKQLIGESAKEYKKQYSNDILKGVSEQEAKQKATKKVIDTIKKKVFMTALFTSAGILLHKLYKDDKEYDEINQQKKYNNYYIKVGNSWVKIKKAQGEERLWINLGEYFADLTSGKLKGKKMSTLASTVGNSIQDTGVSDDFSAFLPPIIGTLIEMGANYDFYYGNKIVPQYMKDGYEPKDWYDENTSSLSKLIGQTFNVAPMYIDYFVKNSFGTTFYDIWKTPDTILGLTGKYPSTTSTSGGAFTVNPYSGSTSLNEFYDRYNELKQKKGSETITSDEETEYKNISAAKSSITDINKQIKEIKKDLTLSSSEKEKQILELQKQRTDTARQAMGKELINSDNESKIDSSKFYPSKDTISKNNYVLAMTSDMKKEYEQLAYEQYQKYKSQGLYSDEYLEKLETKCKDYAKNYMLQKYQNQLTKNK